MDGQEDVRRTVNLDRQTDALLKRLANAYDGNASMAVRRAIRNEAQRAGLVPAERGQLEHERVRA